MKKYFLCGLDLFLFAFITLLIILSCTEKTPLVFTGNIEGTVYNMETNDAISNVNVSYVAVGKTESEKGSTTTSSDGKFSINDLPAGNYLLTFINDGYGDISKNISVQPGETSPCFVGMQPVKPKLAVSRSELNFGTTETNLSFQLTNIGKGELKWEVKESIDWLSVNHRRGTTLSETSSVSVIINRVNAVPGNYERIVSVTSNGGDAEILIKVINVGPKLDVSPLNLNFGSDLNKKSILLKNIGAGSLDYTVSSDVAWISIIPNNGNITNETDQIEISVSRNGLNYGNYSGKINVLSNEELFLWMYK